jgi:peroxiredoxin Q/BCP
MSEDSTALPQAGKKAPAFTMLNDLGEKVSLSGLKGKKVVMYFYPKDDTPGCTVEAKEFRDAAADFEKAGALIFGVSPDDQKSHCKFRDKFDLNFRLLVDAEHAVAEKYGVWVEKSMYGKKYMGVQRATFLIDGDGKVAQVWPKVTPAGHAAEVLAAVKALG